MNSLLSAQHVIDLIVRESKDKINQNQLVRTMLVPYSQNLVKANRNDAVLHAGTHFDRSSNNFFKKQIDSEQKPKNNIKDTYTFFSLKKSKLGKKQNLSLPVQQQKSPKKALKKFFKTSGFKSNASQRQKSTNKNVSTPAKSTIQMEPLKDTFFIKLQEQEVKIPRFMQKEQSQINYLRQIKHKEYQERETQRKRFEQNSEVNTARQKKILAQLQSHLEKPNNHYTYDAEGGIIFCSSETNKKAIAKPYPPTMRYDIENEQDFGLKRKYSNRNRAYSNLQFKRREKLNVQIFGDKGDMSMTQTINISRVSLGNEQIDSAQFMRRNDRFNNNHQRQTTSIPFLKMEGGTAFKQTTTNLSISNYDIDASISRSNIKKQTQKNTRSETRAKSHDCRARRQFKKYCFRGDSLKDFDGKLQLQSGSKFHSNTSNVFKKINSIGDSRYSSFYIQRPHTTEVGKIRRENETLYDSMLQQS